MSNRSLFLFSTLLITSFPSFALDITVTGPKGARLAKVSNVFLLYPQSIAQVTQNYLPQGPVPTLAFSTDQKGLESIYGISPKREGNRGFGWCCRVDGTPLAQSPADQSVDMFTSKIEWYYGYVRLGNSLHNECKPDESRKSSLSDSF